jgi:hypothetical protein
MIMKVLVAGCFWSFGGYNYTSSKVEAVGCFWPFEICKLMSVFDFWLIYVAGVLVDSIKLGLGEPDRARCGSGRLEPARELPASRAEPV